MFPKMNLTAKLMASLHRFYSKPENPVCRQDTARRMMYWKKHATNTAVSVDARKSPLFSPFSLSLTYHLSIGLVLTSSTMGRLFLFSSVIIRRLGI